MLPAALTLLLSTIVPADGRLERCTAVAGPVAAPCGQPMELPPGKHVAWIERGGEITPFLTEVESGRKSTIDGPFVPAGEVRTGEPVRVFDVETRRGVGKAFERHGSGSVPAGRVVAAIMDDRGGIVGLSRPVRVPGGGSVNVTASAGSHVIAFLKRPRAGDEVHVALDARPPDVFSDAGDRVLAIWYDIDAPRARITASSKTLELEPVEITPRPNRITDVRGELRLLPSIDVTIAPLPREVKTPLHVSVALATDSREIRKIEVAPGRTYRIEALPRDVYSVALLVGGGEVEQPVNLTSGADAALTFAPEPIVVSGVVKHGSEPARAKVSFRLSRSRADAESDDLGRYELLLWQPRMYEVLVTLSGAGAPPPLKDFVSVQRDMTWDVAIPKTDVRVRVVDARTQQPIAKAEAGVLNAWGGTMERPAHRQSQNVTTDENGVARFAPLRPGQATVYVSAKGYFAARPREIVVADDTATVIDVALEPEGERRTVTLLLPDSTPATGAEVFVEQASWSATAGADGSVGIPRVLGAGPVLVRHPKAASAIRRLDSETAWRLAPAAPPLRLQVERWTGWPDPASVTIWIDGLPVSGNALRFLTRAPASLPSHGDWVAHHLPAAPLRIIARRGQLPAAAQDALAATIPFPWPANAKIQVAD
ncbi:MAG TPA: carboxypeptidase-like regulatory domain-containing protein [Thermoanaerobaculia bacterium]|nr:carboxypeptidase-like regulatory domain-containing protein [Thermoanaerobaculia bacterium]